MKRITRYTILTVSYSLIGIVIVFIALLTGKIISNPRSVRAASTIFYPSFCLGGWSNPKNASGQPDLSISDPPSSYTTYNSAFLASSVAAQIFCGYFSTDQSTNPPTAVVVQFQWLIGQGSLMSARNTVASTTVASTTNALQASSSPAFRASSPIYTPLKMVLDSSSSTSASNLSSSNNPMILSTTTSTTSVSSTGNNSLGTSTTQSSSSISSTTTSVTPNIQSTSSTTSPATSSTSSNVDASTNASPSTGSGQVPPPPDTSSPPSSSAPDTSSPPPPPPPALPPTTDTPPPAPVTAPPTSPGDSTVNSGPTSFIENIMTKFAAIAEAETDDPSRSSNPFLQISYSTDGVRWVSIGTVGLDNWKDYKIAVPISSWEDLNNLQIMVSTLPTLDEKPDIYLDGMYAKVSYDRTLKEALSDTLASAADAVYSVIDPTPPSPPTPTPTVVIKPPPPTPAVITKKVVSFVLGGDPVVDKSYNQNSNIKVSPNLIGSSLVVSGNCSRKYFVILAYRDQSDYKKKPSSYVVNNALECNQGSFHYDLSNLSQTIDGGKYWLLTAEEDDTGGWTPVSQIFPITVIATSTTETIIQ